MKLLYLIACCITLWLSFAAYAKPTLVIQGDKTYQVRSIAISNGAKWIASSDYGSNIIKIFDGKEGLEWGTFLSASGKSPLHFTPDSSKILTTVASDAYNGFQTHVMLCEVPSGHVLHTFKVAPFPVWCSNTRLRGFRDGALVEFDLKTGKQTSSRILQQMPAKGARPLHFAFSKNGDFIVEGSTGVIRFWQSTTGKLLGSIKDPLRAIGKTAISDDGKWIASEGDDPKWSPPTDGPMTEASYSRNYQLHVWNAKTHQLIHTFPGYYSLSGGASFLAFSPDGKTLFAAGDSNLDRFNLRDGKNSPLPPVSTDFRHGLERPVIVSDDGSWMAGIGQIYQSSDFGSGMQLWSLKSSSLKEKFGGTLRGASQVKWSPDGKYLAGGDRLTLWDAHTGRLLAENPHSYAHDFSWVSPTVIRSQTLGKIQLWHVPDLKLQGEFSFQSPDEIHNPADAYSGGLSISPNGHTVLTTGTKFGDGLKGELWVWDVQKKMLLRKIKTDKDLWGFTQFKDVIWLPDNRHIVFGTRTKLVLLNIETGKVEKERTDPDAPQFKAGPFSSALRPLRVSSDGRWLAVISTHTGKLLIIDVNTFAVAPPGGVQWWKNVTANTPKPLIAPNVKAALSPHGRLMAFGANSVTSNGVSIWNVSQNREVVRLYLLGGDSQSTTLDWIAITPEGYYAASPAGEKRLRWRDGNTFWSIARSHAHFFRPDIVAKALQSH